VLKTPRVSTAIGSKMLLLLFDKW